MLCKVFSVIGPYRVLPVICLAYYVSLTVAKSQEIKDFVIQVAFNI